MQFIWAYYDNTDDHKLAETYTNLKNVFETLSSIKGSLIGLLDLLNITENCSEQLTSNVFDQEFNYFLTMKYDNAR